MGKAVKKHTRRRRVAPPREIPEARSLILPRLSADERARIQKQQAELAKARGAIDRTNAIRDGLIPPPWVKKPKQKDDGRQIQRIKEALPRAYPPEGNVPDGHTNKQVQQRLAPWFDQMGWKLAGVDSIARVRGRRR